MDPTLLAHGLQAFLEYMPIRPNAADPHQLFRRFRWGRAVDLFILDERQYRSAERFWVRDGHLVLIPIVQDPQCFLGELAAPKRTMLGARQQAWLTRELLTSEATFKVIINAVPMSELYVLPYDRWESYVAEREVLLQFMRANLRNVIFLTTDLHGTVILEAIPFSKQHPRSQGGYRGADRLQRCTDKDGYGPSHVEGAAREPGPPRLHPPGHLQLWSGGGRQSGATAAADHHRERPRWPPTDRPSDPAGLPDHHSGGGMRGPVRAGLRQQRRRRV